MVPTSWWMAASPSAEPAAAATGPQKGCRGALWVDDAFWFETGARTRKGRNVAGDPRCSMAVSLLEFDLVVEGAAEMITEPAVVATMAGHWADQGWPAQPDETGTALTAPYSAQSAGPPPWQVYRIQPTSAYALQTVEPFGATRWRF